MPGSVLDFTVTAMTEWLSLDPGNGVSDRVEDTETVMVSVDTSGVDVGTHAGTIVISDPRATNDPTTLAVTLMLCATGQIGDN